MYNGHRRSLTATAVAVVGVLAASSAEADQQSQILGAVAGAVYFYDDTKDTCFYEPEIGNAVDRLDTLFMEADPYLWADAKRKVERSLPFISNFARAVTRKGETSDELDCATVGRLMANGLTMAILAVPMTDDLTRAIERLSSGGGRPL